MTQTRAQLIAAGILKPSTVPATDDATDATKAKAPVKADFRAIKARKHEAACLTAADRAVAILRAACARPRANA